MPLKEYDTIQLRDEYQGTLGNPEAITKDHDRTPDRDKVATHIVENVIKKDRWPLNMTTLADETDFSRQLVSEVVKDYFIGVDEEESKDQNPVSRKTNASGTGSPSIDGETQKRDNDEIPDSVFVLVNDKYKKVSIDIPDDVEDKSAYKRGFLDGLRV